MKQKISAIMCVYNEEKLIERALKSLKGAVDEILVMHDGLCKDNTLKIARKYTNKIIVNKRNVGLPGPILPILLRKAKGPWILKIDADEILSKEMRKNLRKLVEDKKVNGYTFLWPLWDGEKEITSTWPRKPSLYRKKAISYLGFPHFDDPIIAGKVIGTEYKLLHRPESRYPLFGWKDFYYRGLKRYGRIQAEWTLKNFDSLDKFQWNLEGYPRGILIRRRFPLLSALPMGIIAFFKILYKGNLFKNGMPVFLEAFQTIGYYVYVGFYIWRLKHFS